jgi:Uma2 family endonuclease
MAVSLTRRRFTVSEYYRMAEAGILTEDDRVELIDGEIVETAPISPGHAGTVNRTSNQFVHTFSDQAVTAVQNPVRLSGHSEPQPDVALLRHRTDFYRSAHPTPADVLLLVEVAETTVASDRQVKIPLYARSGIPEVWLVDLDQVAITAYREPSASGYRAEFTVRRGEQIAPLAFPDRPVAATDILGE